MNPSEVCVFDVHKVFVGLVFRRDDDKCGGPLDCLCVQPIIGDVDLSVFVEVQIAHLGNLSV